ncbi:MAG: ATP-binding protein [Desulfococcaceae bacterium]|jgi:PAS domain S-box-containing protein|nr:ATP-binding protein [Desulfococcaceae bacterium]
MPKPSESEKSRKELRRQVLGFGESSHQKSYYPLLKQRLRELERLRILLDHSADAMFWAEVPSGRILDMNTVAENFIGQKHGEKKAVYLHNIFSPDTWKQMWKLFSGDLARKRGNRSLETELLPLDGAQIPVEMTVGFHRMEERTFSMVVVRDISERKQAREEHAALEARLRQSQKMEAIGQLAGGVAHDFNNLLQVIQGNGELIRFILSEDHPILKNIGEIMKAAERARSLVQQLLLFSRRETVIPRFLNINEVIRNLADMLRRVIGEHIRLELNCAPALPALYADPVQMEQILINLCVNARDAMPEGGSIRIESSTVQKEDILLLKNTGGKADRYILLSVADTGKGIPEDIQERIFEPFFTTKEIGKGTGLGLATVYAIVERHKGNISVSSKPGKGSRFDIYLPAGEKKIGTKAEESRERIAKGRGECILVAEDEEHVRLLLVQILENAGYRVFPAYDGRAAIDIFQQYGHKIDLAMLDMVMPEKSGKAVYDTIRAQKSRIPVLFSTGYSFDLSETHQIHDEDVKILQKPHTSEELLALVRQMLDRNADRGSGKHADVSDKNPDTSFGL